MSDGPPPKRLRLSKEQLTDMGKNEIIEHLISQDSYMDILEAKALDGQNDNFELVCLRESEEKMKQQQLEATRRENVLVMRLTTKEQEMQEYANQIQELKQAQIPGMTQLRSTLLDPAVNLMFERMKKELDATKAKLEETQNDLSAWKFTPDSNTGKRLMAKCRLLHQENEELGKIISSGRVAKLEADLALHRNFSEEMKKSQADLDEFLMELDEDVEGMQSTIYYLQQQLREAKDSILKLQQDNHRLRTSQESSFKSEVMSVDDQSAAEKSEVLTNSSDRNRMLDVAPAIVKKETDSTSCMSPLSAANTIVKEKYLSESSIPYDDEPSDKETKTSLTESDRNLRTPPPYASPNSTLIISVAEDNEEETSLDIDIDTVEKTGDDATEANGDDNASPYTSETSRSPCTPVTKSPSCKEHSNEEAADEENVSEIDSNSMDASSNICGNSVQPDGSALRHWSSVNGVAHDKNNGD